ncbi:MAG: right-handed parallel beta-helix repeat-containing protein [Myxococcota bacterium]
MTTRGLIPALALLPLLLAGAIGALPNQRPPGDVNGDRELDVADTLALAQHLRGHTLLDAAGLAAADIAPVVSGIVSPDGEVNVADLMVLTKVVGRELGPDAPALDPVSPTPPNPASVSGTAAPGALVHLFVSDGAGNAVHVETATADGLGTFSVASLPLIYDGTNEIFAMAEDASGYLSAASLMQTVSSANAAPQLAPSQIASGVQVWTKHQNGPYEIPSGGLSIAAGATLVLGPGAVLEFKTGDTLDVSGELVALGSSTEAVAFRAETTDWDGFDFQAAASSLLSHATIHQVHQSAGRAVYVRSGADLTIRNSLIDVSNVNLRGVQVDSGSSLSFEWSEARGASERGIFFNSASVSKISHSLISGFNICLDLNFGGAHVIENTEITGCSTGAFARGTRAKMFPGNRFHGLTTGILLFAENCPGFGCWKAADKFPAVRDSVFENNNTHINAGAASQWTGDNDGRRAVMDARRNYWGETDPDLIADKITDVTDNFIAGSEGYVSESSDGALVDFTPIRTSAGGPLDYTYVSGRIDLDFDPAISAPAVREAVGPLLLWDGLEATIPAGTTIETFVDEVNGVPIDILISGTLTIAGTSADPVVFTGPGPSPLPGDWWGIRLDADSTASALDYIEVSHAIEAIRAESTDISINNADLALFSRAGVVLDQVASSSEVTDSVISGVISSPPLVTVKDDPDGNVTGVEIIDSFAGCAASPGTCGSISGNAINHLVTGIHVLGGSDPELIGNYIQNNIWGIWLQATASGEPLPRLRQNVMDGNAGATPPIPPGNAGEKQFRFCSVLGGSNLCLSDYVTTGASAIIDAKENYWGSSVVTPADALATIQLTEGQRVAVEASRFTNILGTVINTTPHVYSAVLVDITRSSPSGLGQTNSVIRPGVLGESIDITFNLVDDADVTLEIFPEDKSGPAVYTATAGTGLSPSGNPHTIQWNGRDDANALVADGAYAYVLTATTASLTDTYDPDRNEGTFVDPDNILIGDEGSGTSASFGQVVDFNTFENDQYSVSYELQESPKRGAPFPSRVTARLMERASATDVCDATNGEGTLVAKPWREQAVWIGFHDFLWDGRADDENVNPGYSAGEIVRDPDIPGEAGFCLFFEAPRALRPNTVIVTGNAPRLTGSAPVVEIQANPFVMRPTYEQTTEMIFTLDQAATVTLYILPPGVTDTQQAIGKVLANGGASIPASTPTAVNWEGWEMPDDPEERVNLLRATADGPHTFALEAVSALSGLSSIYRGVLNIRGEIPPGS